MTETSPVASVCRLDGDQELLSDDEQADLRTGVGRICFGVECRVVEPGSTVPVPRDGVSSGELQCRGPWIAATYYNDPRAGDSFTDDGWLRTGDVATMDERGRIRLVDRTKDLIKSGGEWISSVELENELMGHPADPRGGGDRHPRPEVVGAPAGLRRRSRKVPSCRSRTSSTTSRPASPSGSSPTTSCSSTRSPRRASASSPRRRCASASPITRRRRTELAAAAG